MSFCSSIFSDNASEAKRILEQKINRIFTEKLDQIKIRLIADLYESNIQHMGRTKIIDYRIRKGKLQKRKKFSNVKGYTIRNGDIEKISSTEHRHRELGLRRSKYKRHAKLRQTLNKRRMSLRRRKALGV